MLQINITLSVTRVSCKRPFSKITLLKTYLRYTLIQDHLEKFHIYGYRKSFLAMLDPENIMKVGATKSYKLKNAKL